MAGDRILFLRSLLTLGYLITPLPTLYYYYFLLLPKQQLVVGLLVTLWAVSVAIGISISICLLGQVACHQPYFEVKNK